MIRVRIKGETQTLDKKVPCMAYFLSNKSSPQKQFLVNETLKLIAASV
jgi:hypothetical protein